MKQKPKKRQCNYRKTKAAAAIIDVLREDYTIDNMLNGGVILFARATHEEKLAAIADANDPEYQPTESELSPKQKGGLRQIIGETFASSVDNTEELHGFAAEMKKRFIESLATGMKHVFREVAAQYAESGGPPAPGMDDVARVFSMIKKVEFIPDLEPAGQQASRTDPRAH